MFEDFEACYRAIRSRDARFDGRFFTAVTTTGIYCRPVCPAQTPHAANVCFHLTAASAEAAGFRACRRCRPHEAPGGPAPGAAGTLADRALRLIAAGVADGPTGVGAVAARLGIGERQLHRVLRAAVGAGALSLARMRRVQTARTLLEQTSMPITDVALCAGFSSLRQFNDAVRRSTRRTPTEIRRRSRTRLPGDGAVVLRLSVRPPFDGAALLRFFAARAIPGVEVCTDRTMARSLRLPNGAAVVELQPMTAPVTARIWLDDMRDLGAAVDRCRSLLDLDADPGSVDEVLRGDAALAPLVALHPGLRVPGCGDAAELALRAVLGQQVSVTRATALAARLTARCGEPLAQPNAGVEWLFPTPAAVLDADLTALGLTGERAATLRRLAVALTEGAVTLDPGTDTAAAIRSLRSLRGIGEWTASYIAMRGLRDPDAFPATDLALRRAYMRVVGADARTLPTRAERWRPWRAYATLHLWTGDADRRTSSGVGTADPITETAA